MKRTIELTAQRGPIKVSAKTSVVSKGHALTREETGFLANAFASEIMASFTKLPFCGFKLIDVKVK